MALKINLLYHTYFTTLYAKNNCCILSKEGFSCLWRVIRVCSALHVYKVIQVILKNLYQFL